MKLVSAFPRVAIIGRPNVGKSTLFNRLCGKKLAIVDDQPGVTRDWREGRADFQHLVFDVLDTPGLNGFESAEIKDQINQLTSDIIDDSDLLLFVLDGREGMLTSDQDLARTIRLSQKPVIILVNKSEGEDESVFLEAQSLGLTEQIVSFSGLHGLGLSDLAESLSNNFKDLGFKMAEVHRDSKRQTSDAFANPSREPVDQDNSLNEETQFCAEEASKGPLQIAIFGRPNAGKSTLINKLLGKNRLVVGDKPGITRDAIRVDWSYEGRPLKLVDTAGVRRRSKVTDRLERLSVREALQAVRFSQVCILVVDALSPLDKQDLLLASKILEEGRALVIAVNKWDRSEKENYDEICYKVGKSLSQVKGVPIIPISALTGKNLDRLMKAVFEMENHWQARIPTGELNRWLEETTTRHPLPLVGSTRLRIKYATQIKTRPPTVALFVSKPKDLPDSYLRYLTTSLREDFNLPGIPIRLLVRKGKNPYVDEK